jgi:hypothetical protein
MRLIKMLGLAAVAALAAMAFVGAMPASAETFCTQSGHHTDECPAANRYNGNLVVTSTSKVLFLQNGEIEDECDSTLLALGATIENEGNHTGVKILVDTGALSFTNCTGLCNSTESINPVWLLAQTLSLDAWVTGDPAKFKIKYTNASSASNAVTNSPTPLS